MAKRLVVGADRLAIPTKDAVVEHLRAKYDHEIVDVGMQAGGEFKAYIDTAVEAARGIQSGEYERGILMCGTGAGMTIIANKHKRITAVLCHTPFEGRMCRTVNRANVLTMGGNVTTIPIALDIVDAFMTTPFKIGFPADRHEFLEQALVRIAGIEDENFK